MVNVLKSISEFDEFYVISKLENNYDNQRDVGV